MDAAITLVAKILLVRIDAHVTLAMNTVMELVKVQKREKKYQLE